VQNYNAIELHLTLEGRTIYVYPDPVRRRGREAEGTRLLNEHTPKEYRGFESRRLRQFYPIPFAVLILNQHQFGRATSSNPHS
jgi:hypothetical protein